MSHLYHPITIERGASWEAFLAVVDEFGEPRDLAYCKVEFRLNSQEIPRGIVDIFSSDTGEIAIDDENGVIAILVSPERSRSFLVEKGNYTIVSIDPFEQKSLLLKGGFSVITNGFYSAQYLTERVRQTITISPVGFLVSRLPTFLVNESTIPESPDPEEIVYDGSQWTMPEAITSSGNPNGSVVGHFGQLCRDTVNGVWYICISQDSGMSWAVI